MYIKVTKKKYVVHGEFLMSLTLVWKMTMSYLDSGQCLFVKCRYDSKKVLRDLLFTVNRMHLLKVMAREKYILHSKQKRG